jgi:hypothetical protein
MPERARQGTGESSSLRVSSQRISRWWAWGLALAGVATACSDSAPPVPATATVWDAQGGSRLLARYLKGEDGTRVFDGWFDRARGEPCQIRRGEGGRYGCYPEANPAVFLDDRCRQPAGEHQACARRYTGVVRGDRRCGNETLALWEEAGPLELPAPFRLSNDFCQAAAAGTPGGPFVTLGGRVPEAALMTGTMEVPRPDLRLGPRVVRFTDGAVAPLELWDIGRNRPCVRVETSQGIRCLPENVLYIGGDHGPYFADRACTVPIAHDIAATCLAPTLALKLDTSSGCALVTAAFALASNQRRDPREVFSGSECRDKQVLPGHFYLPGDPVELTNYPELTVQESGSGRIRLRSFSATDSVPIPVLGQHLYDTQLAVECRVAVAGDGVLRCLPRTGPVLDADAATPGAGFADAACTRPLARYRTTQACAGPRPPAPMVARASRRRCLPDGEGGLGSRDDRQPGRWDILRLGARHDGDVFFAVGGACQPGARAPNEQLYELGEPLDPGGFVAFHPE